MGEQQEKAIVLTSGGLDSTTALAIAKSQGYQCHTLSFDYGQRSLSELRAAEIISRAYGAIAHKSIKLDLASIGGSALTDKELAIPDELKEGIPITYVPARNTVFLSIALAFAEVTESSAIFIGVNAVDYSGYPDCRPEFIDAFTRLANVATKVGVEGQGIKIETPLIDLTKAQIIEVGQRLGVDYSKTVSCYQATEFGAACGVCDSCRLRKQGFADANQCDPTIYESVQ